MSPFPALFRPDGTEDPNFLNWSSNGIVPAFVNSVVIQPNNMVLVGGTFSGGDGNDFGAARFNVDGSLDGNFGGGYVTNNAGASAAYGMVLQPDGSIIAAGTSTASATPLLARITAGDVGGVQVRVDSVSPALPLSGDGYAVAGDTYTLTLGSPLPPGEGGAGLMKTSFRFHPGFVAPWAKASLR